MVSPLPYQLTTTRRQQRTGGGSNSYVLDCEGAYVTNEIRNPDNAAFIVRACNSHDDLLAALKDMREACAAAMRVIAANDLDDQFIEAVHQAGLTNGFGVRAQAAIAKAEGC
jgi:hypothetical protein